MVGSAMVRRVLSTISTKNARHSAANGIQAARRLGYVRGAAAGFVVCVPEFRRTGQRGGGWPGTFDDVATAVDTLPALVREAAGAHLISDGPVVLAGHSAGGHLALWAASRHRLPPDASWHAPQGEVRGVVALAAVSDLVACHALRLGRGAADALLGGGPGQHPDRYRLADPMQLLPVEPFL